MKIKSHSLLCLLATIALSSPLTAMGVNAQKAASHTWNPNVKNGMYRNPVIDADYSDPDVCRLPTNAQEKPTATRVRHGNCSWTAYTTRSRHQA